VRWDRSTELATHLFRECWAEGTGSDVDLCRVFGWEVESHNYKVATAADLVARGLPGRQSPNPKRYDAPIHMEARSDALEDFHGGRSNVPDEHADL
jgi:hypothetical protein